MEDRIEETIGGTTVVVSQGVEVETSGTTGVLVAGIVMT
jgi:hypothetical protein